MTWHERRIYHTLSSISVFPFFQLLQLLECLSGYMCGDNVTIKFPPDFHNYTGLNKFVNCVPWFTIATPNELILGWKPHWSAKRKENIMWEMVARRCSAKTFSKNFSKFTEKYLCDSIFLTLLKVFTLSGLQLFYRKTSSLWLQNKPFVVRCSWIIYKIHRKAPEFPSRFR